MAASPEYRTFIGFVKFPLRDSEIKIDGEPVTVRNFLVREAGVKEQAIDVRATLWPSHNHVELDAGDAVLIEGKFTVNKGENADGEPQTYFNLSVSKLLKLGKGDEGMRDGGSSSSSSASDDDDEPW